MFGFYQPLKDVGECRGLRIIIKIYYNPHCGRKEKQMEIKKIATLKTDFNEKFGIPRQSGRSKAAKGTVIFEKEFRDESFIRGIEQFSHLWLLFDFSLAHSDKISATVRPPRLGGNEHIGVFASRSPFRPNNIGLSCVCLDGIEKTENEGTLLKVSGVDILNGTPIYDIKPYIPYADSYPEACGGYAEKMQHHCLCVNFPPELLQKLPDDKWRIFFDCISDDPRPSYQNDPNRVYHIVISNYEVGFKVDNQTATVTEVKKIKNT